MPSPSGGLTFTDDKKLSARVEVACKFIKGDRELFAAYRKFLRDNPTLTDNYPAASMLAFLAGWNASQLAGK